MSKELSQTSSTGLVVRSRQERLRDALSVNTRDTYKKAIELFIQAGYNFPASAEQCAQFIENQAAQGASINSLKVYKAAIAYGHHVAELPDPTQDRQVAAAIQIAVHERKEKGIATAPRQVTALRKKDIEVMLQHSSGIKLLRDKALLVFGLSTACRRSELARMRLEDIKFMLPAGIVVTIPYGKTDQEAQGESVYIPATGGPWCPVRTLQKWLGAAGIQGGPLFRRINRGGTVLNESISASGIVHILKDLAKKAGLDEENIAGHSLRAGCATALAEAGAKRHKIKSHGRWKSSVYERYIRDTEGFEDNPVAQIWD